jgi:hypothetical protein
MELFFCFNLKKGVLAGAAATIVLLVLTLTIIVCWWRAEAEAEANAGKAAKPPAVAGGGMVLEPPSQVFTVCVSISCWPAVELTLFCASE